MTGQASLQNGRTCKEPVMMVGCLWQIKLFILLLKGLEKQT